MIPNSAPMAAVYQRDQDKSLFSLPVVAWGSSCDALVPNSKGAGLQLASLPETADGYLGLWMYDWNPTHDEMASLLPEHVPGTPHPLSVSVTVRETPQGWEAFRTDNNRFVTESTSYEQLEQRLVVMLGTTHIDAIVPMNRDT